MTQLFVILSDLPWGAITLALIVIVIVGEALASHR
jgi:hypothetical protein